MRALRFIFGLSLLALCAAPTIFLLTLMLPFRAARVRVVGYLGGLISNLVMWTVRVRVTYVGEDRLAAAPAIYVANHTSTLDIFLFSASTPSATTVVMKKEMIWVPIVGQIGLLSGSLRIDRKNLKAAKEGLAEIAELVRRHGFSMFVMPEGTRSRDGELQPFKRGFVHLAIATGLPVVPMVFHGAKDCWPRDAVMPKPGNVTVEVLPAIDTSGWRAEEAGAIADDLYRTFAEALGRRGCS